MRGMCMHACATLTHMCTHGGQKLMSDVLLYISPLLFIYFSKTGSLTELGDGCWGDISWSVNLQSSPVSVPQCWWGVSSRELQAHCAWFSHRCWRSKLRSSWCTASALATEPAPWPYSASFLKGSRCVLNTAILLNLIFNSEVCLCELEDMV